jgi:hypothetical protein
MLPSSLDVDVNEICSPDSGAPGSNVNEAVGPIDSAATAKRPATPATIRTTANARRMRRGVSRLKPPTIKLPS